MPFLILLGGGIALYFGAEWMVRGSVGIAARLGIPRIVIGLTIVAFGTSAPELAVSVSAALKGNSAVALGNVIGSNIANIALVLGLVALIRPPIIDPALLRRDVYWFMASVVLLPILCLDGHLSKLEGVLLLLTSIGFIGHCFLSKDSGQSELSHPILTDIEELDKASVITSSEYDSQTSIDESRESSAFEDIPDAPSNLFNQLMLLVVGLLLLFLGGRYFVEGASQMAHSLGISDRIIALTIVAIGTSLPELAASLVAALRGQSEIAVGNIVGSNLLNTTLILGSSATLGNLIAPLSSDTWWMVGLSSALIFGIFRWKSFPRWVSAPFLISYATFIYFLAF